MKTKFLCVTGKGPGADDNDYNSQGRDELCAFRKENYSCKTIASKKIM